MARDEGEIVAVEARIYGCAVDEPFGYSQGFIAARESAVARVETACGAVGWGEAYASARPAAAAIQSVGQRFVGWSVLERSAAWRSYDAREPSAAVPPADAAALSAICLAALDAAARIMEQPVRALLSGMADPPLRPYASALWFRPGSDPTAHYPDALRRARDTGFTAVKAKIGLDVQDDLRALARLRSAAGATALMLDANQFYDRAAAARIARDIADDGAVWFEEPFPASHRDDYAWLRTRSPVPIAGGESITSLADALEWVTADAVSVLQPDVCLVGGLDAAGAISDLAAAHQIPTAPHCFGLGIGLAATLHWASVLARDGAVSDPVWIEVDTAPHPARDRLLASCAWFRDGGANLTVPAEPGLGVEPDLLDDYRLL